MHHIIPTLNAKTAAPPRFVIPRAVDKTHASQMSLDGWRELTGESARQGEGGGRGTGLDLSRAEHLTSLYTVYYEFNVLTCGVQCVCEHVRVLKHVYLCMRQVHVYVYMHVYLCMLVHCTCACLYMQVYTSQVHLHMCLRITWRASGVRRTARRAGAARYALHPHMLVTCTGTLCAHTTHARDALRYL